MAALLATLLLAATAPGAPLVAVGELNCAGRVTSAQCGELTAALVRELARDGRWEVVRQSELRKEQEKCGGDPACIRRTRRDPAKVVSGTVLPQAKGGSVVRIRLLDARKMSKEAEASAAATADDAQILRAAVEAAARTLLGG